MKLLAIHRAFALGMFRSSVFFVLAVIAFKQSDPKTQTILLTVVFLLDVVSWHLCQVIEMSAEGVYNRVWIDTLQDRFFIDGLLEDVRAGLGVNVAHQREESSRQTREDVERFAESATLWFRWGGFRKTLLGIAYFLWFWLSYAIFCESARGSNSAGAGSNAIKTIGKSRSEWGHDRRRS